MKNLKVLFVVALFVAFATSGFADSPNKENPVAYQKEKIDINRDVAQIHAQKNNIKALKAQLKKDCKADRTQAVIIDKKELRKARADLLRSRLHLMADKKDLKADHRLAMRNLRRDISKNRENLAKAESDRAKCASLGKNCDAAVYSASIAQYQRQLSWNKKQLKNEREGLSADLAAINKGLKADHYTAVFNVEGMTASTATK